MSMLVGIDEVGRGPWAGPLVFGAVILGDASIDGLTDSKKLTAKKRKALSEEIYARAQAVGLGWVSAQELDELGMQKALEVACRRALEEIKVPYHQIIIDGTVNVLKNTGKGRFVTTLKQADLLVPSVSAASIIAKVARDNFMHEMAELYPAYGFEKHVGYGTTLHRAALDKYGLTPLHRRSFRPISDMLSVPAATTNPPVPVVTTRAIGDASENTASEYLEKNHFHILERNWKTRVCEIDIVAEKNGVWYFIEVKHRRTSQQGGGLAAITPRKLGQMKFAAQVYAHYRQANETNMRLAVITTTGDRTDIVDFIELD